MKRSFLIGSALFAAALATTLATNSVNAADGDKTSTSDLLKTSNATLSVEDNDSDHGKLVLTEVPSFDFGKPELSNLISTGFTSEDKAGSGSLTVKDLTGTSKGWNITARLSTFTHETETTNTLDKGTLTLSASAPKWNTNSAEVTGIDAVKGTLNVGGDAVGVQKAQPKFGQGTTETNPVNGKLVIPATATATTGVYTATITWTLGSGQTPEAAPATDSVQDN
ncbi:WxL domain-containing protein [Lacticaseibacillus jixiensis]|uniref:WxL domain-containing protein n=1 Tax=Lacticaseibacillus jixiensis TaxID=3231926 RepID=UPI0036F1B0A5